MIVLRTTKCSPHGHREFRIQYDPVAVPVERDALLLPDWLEESVAQGERFEAGQTCQIGWMVIEVRTAEDGFLTLWEPDMRAMPIAWTESVSNTLVQLRLQKDVVESVLTASDLSFPSLLQSAIICNRLAKGNACILARDQASGRDSGWFVGCRADDHSHNDAAQLKCVSLYEAAVRYAPQIIPYLAMPAGTFIDLDDGPPRIFRDDEPLHFKSGSLLAARHP
jgi:hypothetical protein